MAKVLRHWRKLSFSRFISLGTMNKEYGEMGERIGDG